MTRYVLTTNGDVVKFPNAQYWKQKNGKLHIMDSKGGTTLGYFNFNNVAGMSATDNFSVNDNNSNQ